MATSSRVHGFRQRMRAQLHAPQAAPAAAVPAVRQGSELADCLLTMWSLGVLSAPHIQTIAAAAVADGLRVPEVLFIAEAGHAGHVPGNISRDLLRNCVGDISVPQTYSIQVDAVDRNRADSSVSVQVDILLPHQIFSHVASTCPSTFSKWTNADNLEAFWEASVRSGDPHLAADAAVHTADFRRRAVPLILHGDGASFSNSESLETASFGALLHKGSTWSSKYVCATWVSSAAVPGGGGTWDQIWAVLVWSFNAMRAGRHPATNHLGAVWPRLSFGARMAGKELTPGGHVGVVHAITGDMAWLAERLRITRFNPGSTEPCELCCCNRTTTPFKDLTAAATWRATVKLPPQPLSSTAPMWNILGVTIFTVRLDAMHVLDLGVLQHFAGSFFFELIYDAEVAGASLQERMQNLWLQVRDLYVHHQTSARLSRLRIRDFCNPGSPHQDFPHLRGIKAAPARGLLPVIASLCERYCDHSPAKICRQRCASNLVEFYKVLYGAGPVLTDVEVTAAQNHFQTAMDAYFRLSANAASIQHRPLYNIVNKMHFGLEIARQTRWLNPTYCWTYGWEDLVGRVKNVAVRSKDGTGPLKVPGRFFHKYRRVLHVNLRE
jgi:hypothetical protein